MEKAQLGQNDIRYIENFLEMMLVERGSCLNTEIAYRGDLVFFSQSLRAKGKNFFTAEQEDFEEILASLNDKFAASSQARRLSALKQFYEFLYSEDLCEKNSGEELERPKIGFRLPKVLNEKQMERLLDSAEEKMFKAQGSKLAYRQACRLYVMLEVLYATGLRISELVSLPIAIFKNDSQSFIVKGKGAKERLLPISQKAHDALSLWFALRNTSRLKDSPYCFPAQSVSGHIARQVVARSLKKHAISIGFPADIVSPHMIRHAFASHLLQRGADLRMVQQLLGHSNIATTQIYTHIEEKKLYDLVDKYHPLGKK